MGNTEITAVTGEKQAALDAAMLQIEKQFGKGSVMRLGDNIEQL